MDALGPEPARWPAHRPCTRAVPPGWRQNGGAVPSHTGLASRIFARSTAACWQTGSPVWARRNSIACGLPGLITRLAAHAGDHAQRWQRINMRPGPPPARPWPELPAVRRALDKRAPSRRSARWPRRCRARRLPDRSAHYVATTAGDQGQPAGVPGCRPSMTGTARPREVWPQRMSGSDERAAIPGSET